MQYVNKLKINEAKFLLTTSNESIINIAEILAFSSHNYFYEVFKKVTGSTPAIYRHSFHVGII